MRNVRNFWLVLLVDGRASSVRAGPRSSDGGFELRITFRERGAVSRSRVHLVGYRHGPELVLRADLYRADELTRSWELLRIDER